jgi:hypothetical protein
VVTAILINAVELFKIVVFSISNQDIWYIRNVLPLFLCSIQLIAIPLAAFTKGRVKEASLDFVVYIAFYYQIYYTICKVRKKAGKAAV